MHSDDAFDESYYRSNGQLGDRPALRYYVHLVRRYVGPGPYLDFGCGTGHLLRRLAEHGPAFGLEVSEFSAERARQTAPQANVVTEMSDLPTGTFGGITAIHVLEHLEDTLVAEVLETWHRILKPGGRVLAVMPDPAGRARRMAGERWNGFSDPTHINLKPHSDWVQTFRQAGFEVIQQGSDGMWNAPYTKLPKILDAALLSGPSLVQFLLGRIILRPGTGESGIFVVQSAHDGA